MKQFLWETLHAIVHLTLPILDRLNKDLGDKLHDWSAIKAFGKSE